MEGAEKKGFVCDSGRKPTDYNHAFAYRATKVPDIYRGIIETFSLFLSFLFFTFQLRLFSRCVQVYFFD